MGSGKVPEQWEEEGRERGGNKLVRLPKKGILGIDGRSNSESAVQPRMTVSPMQAWKKEERILNQKAQSAPIILIIVTNDLHVALSLAHAYTQTR